MAEKLKWKILENSDSKDSFWFRHPVRKVSNKHGGLMSAQTTINRTINFLGESGYALIGNSIPFLAVGAGAGLASGIGAAKGAFQGLIASGLHSWVVSPINNYISRNEGDEPGKISKSAKYCCFGFWEGSKAVAAGMVTYAVADTVLTAAGQYVPSGFIDQGGHYDLSKAALVGAITLTAPYVIPAVTKIATSATGAISARFAVTSTSNRKSDEKSVSVDQFHDSSSHGDLTAVASQDAPTTESGVGSKIKSAVESLIPGKSSKDKKEKEKKTDS
jgi:hypothetical protein